ncbi:MAG: glycoside hydrolase family 2, partial [Bacteroidetes bacterium]|nr:glycoside hydrolase family 2 [Bacteroidota bacterium]
MYWRIFVGSFVFVFITGPLFSQRQTKNFDRDWRFHLGDDSAAIQPAYNDKSWRLLNLPHDWSIEGPFSEKASSTIQQGALPTGIGWYRKTFTLPVSAAKRIYIEFDGIYRNSEVWINGHSLGVRPYGYSSFCYDLTPWLLKPGQSN